MGTSSTHSHSIITTAEGLQKAGLHQDALEVLSGVAKEGEEPDQVLYLRAQMLRSLDRVEESLTQLHALLQRNPQHTWALNDLGVHFFRTGEPAKALESFRQSLLADNGNGTALENLLSAMHAEGQTQEAIRLAVTIRRQDPSGRGIGEVAMKFLRDREEEFMHSRAIIGRVACLGKDVIRHRYGELGSTAFYNQQKVRVDLFLDIVRGALKPKASVVEPFMQRADVFPLIMEQEILPWFHVKENVRLLVMDSYAELTDRRFVHRKEGWSFCSHFTDVVHTQEFDSTFEHVGLIPIDSVGQHYWDFFTRFEKSYPAAQVVFLHYPAKLDPKKEFRRRGDAIRSVMGEIARLKPYILNTFIDDQLVDWNENDRFPYHFAVSTQKAFAERWKRLEDNRPTVLAEKPVKTACVVQGDIRRGVDEVLEEVQRHFDVVILSTWKSDEARIPKGDFHLILNEKPSHPGSTNRNYQRKNSAAGIALAESLGCTHVMKLRTDMLPVHLDVPKLLNWAHTSVPDGIPSRVVTCAFRNISVDPDWFSTIPDLFAFGSTEMMKLLWGDFEFDYALDMNIPARMATDCGLEWRNDPRALGTFCPEAELYAVFKDRLERLLSRSLDHTTIAKQLFTLINHEELGLCWFDPQRGFRSIVQALEHPWWTEQIWRHHRPQLSPKGYSVSEEQRQKGALRTLEAAQSGLAKQQEWYREHKDRRTVERFNAFLSSIRPATWQHHDEILAWSESCEANAVRFESEESYRNCSDPLVRQGKQLADAVRQQFKDIHAGAENLRIMIHIPDLHASPGGYSLFSNLAEALRFIGIQVRVLGWDEGIEGPLEEFQPTVFMTSDHEFYLSRIDWSAVDRYRVSHTLRIGLTASLAEYGNTPLEGRLEWARAHSIDFFYSFRAPGYLRERKEYAPFFDHGYQIFSIEFAANPLIHYPVPSFNRDLDFVFLGSVNQDKWDRYEAYFGPVLSRIEGFLDGPGWPAIRRKSKSLKKDRYLYARGKIGLNLHLNDQVEWANEINERTYILAACGIPQVVDSPKLLPERFSADALFSASTPEEYAALVQYVLDHPEEAERRALKAQREVFERHTWFHRAEGLVRDLLSSFFTGSSKGTSSTTDDKQTTPIEESQHMREPLPGDSVALPRNGGDADFRSAAVSYYRALRSRFPHGSVQESRFVHPAWARHLRTLGSVINDGLKGDFLMHPICLENFVRQGWFKPQELELAYLRQVPVPLQKKIALIRESSIGGVPVHNDQLGISVNTLGMLWYYARIHQHLIQSPRVIVEFGGGYGSLARIFRTIGDERLTYVIIDLPEMLALQCAFLQGSLGKEVVISHVSGEEPIVQGKINLYPVLDIERLNCTGDLFISTFALSETPSQVQRIVAEKRKFFSASHVYVTGQFPDERSELGWEAPQTIVNAARAMGGKAALNRFHIGANYELLASAMQGKSDSGDPGTVGIVFSKDRAMQLDCTLRSLLLHCEDPQKLDLKVLYTTSNDMHERQYEALRKQYSRVTFIKEAWFKDDLLAAIGAYRHVLFLVDDNVFVRDFSVDDVSAALSGDGAILGVSLRLGKNTTTCYMLNKVQSLPEFKPHAGRFLSFQWTSSELDFGYPLELSSSVYRVDDLLPVLEGSDYRNPNTLELQLDAHKALFADSQNVLLCYPESRTFCVPINSVQTEWQNRVGTNGDLTPVSLARDFDKGYRVNVEAFSSFTPNGCHQECPLEYYPMHSEQKRDTTWRNGLISIVLLNYNGLENLRLCLDSIARNTLEPHEIIVIDNGSTDGSLKYLRSLETIILVENSENKGCPGARAQGMSVANGDFVVLLDNDTVVTWGWLGRLIRHAESDPTIGILGPRSNYVSGPQIVPQVKYTNIAELESFAEAFSRQHAGQSSESHRLVGFCMFIRRAVISRIGNIDASFGKFGFEDDDYTWRARVAGFKTLIAHDVFVHHTGGPQGRGDTEYNKLLFTAWETFKRKWRIPASVSYGAEFDVNTILTGPFDPKKHYVPLLDRETVRSMIAQRPSLRREMEEAFSGGILSEEQQAYEDAIRHFEKAATIIRESGNETEEVSLFDVNMHLGDCYFKVERLQEARECFESALRSNPESPEACFGLGLCFQYAGLTDAARQMFEGASILNPSWEKARSKVLECSQAA